MAVEEAGSIDHEGRRIAWRRRAGSLPGVAWLGGYRSDMRVTKAEAIDDWAAATGRAFLRHDYSGHGDSSGAFAEGTISLWLSESLAVFRALSSGPNILVGSSMGAWIALRMAQELAKAGEGGRVAGMLLLAPAPDFTVDLVEPGMTDEQRLDVVARGYFETPSEYSGEPNVFTEALLSDGHANRVLTRPIETSFPVTIIQGMMDPDVPAAHARRLADLLPQDRVELSLIPDGDHRLSRPQDIEMILSALDALVARTGAP